MKRLSVGVVVVCLIAICFLASRVADNEVKYDGDSLNIAVIGDIPELINEKIHFESLSLEKISENTSTISTDAIMITPKVFELASNDKFADVYKDLEIPIIFFGSNKSHYPFVNEGLTYETTNYDSMENGSHTTIYLNDVYKNKHDAWYYYLDDKKNLDVLYRDIFKKIEEL